jgi:hypothetical protein
MKTINTIIYYLYIPLGIAILVCLIILLSRVVKLLKQVGQTLQSAAPISDRLQKINAASERIGKTKGSWTFYLALGGGLSLLKDARKNYQKEKSLPKSIAKAAIAHGSQISKLRF